MKSLNRLVVALILVLLVATADSLVAQRISIGGINAGGNQADQDDDDDNNNNNNNNQNSNRQGRRRSQSNNQSDDDSDSNQVQQFLQGGQGNQGQGGSNQNRLNRQGQQQGQFPNNIQFQNGQPQNWQQFNQGGISLGNWNGGKWNGSNKITNWTQTFGGNTQPFSAQWYNDHPKAWKYNNNNANIWVVATLPGVYNWLGWGNVPQQYVVHDDHVHHFDHAHYGDWYPLGVFSLMSGPGDSGTRIVQLVIDHHGHIAGNYYDMITNSNYSVSGDVSQQSQRVSWTLNKNKAIRFRAHIGQLLQPYGTINVRLPGGEQQWQFVRLED